MVRLAAALFLSAALLAAQEPSLERQAFRAYQERDWPAAVRLYEAFHASGGGTPSTWDNLGVALATLGEWERAAAALRRAIGLDPRHRWAYNHLGFVYREQGRLEEALAHFRRQIEISAEDPYAWRNLAGTLVLLDRLDEAEKAAEEHERRTYERGAVYIDMACNLHALRRPQEAKKYLERAHSLGAERSLLAQEWGHHYLTVGNHRGAEQEYRKLLEYRPYDAAGILRLAALYFDTGNLEKAAETLARVMEVSETGLVTLRPSANTTRTVTIEELRRDARAGAPVLGDLPVNLGHAALLVRLARLAPIPPNRAAYEEFLASGLTGPAEGWTREALGRILLEAGDYPAGIEQLRRALALLPDRRITAFRLARALERTGQTGEALALYVRSIAPPDPARIDCGCEQPDIAARERIARSLYARLHGDATGFAAYRDRLARVR
jgi:tetratricopeptide (TPR) repeat protein